MKSLREVPELRHLFSTARRYMRGEASIQQLNGTIGQLKALAKFGLVDENIQTLLSEWEIMVNRRWNEWSLEESPLTEEQFVSWITRQLVFDSSEPEG